MSISRIFAITSLVACSVNAAVAQQYYDLTEYYLENARFEQHIDYDANAADSVINKVLSVPGWAKDYGSIQGFKVGAVFQYGTKAKVYKSSMPATGPEGTAQGACLAIAVGGPTSYYLNYYKNVALPAGNYQFVVTYSNANSAASNAVSNSGWYVGQGKANVLSSVTTFEYGVWKNDTIRFTLDETTTGAIRIGISPEAAGITDKQPVLVVDHVQLLRDYPYGDIDEATPQPVMLPDVEVETDPRYARGATMAFGRIKTAKTNDGTTISERGFCWSEKPNPTVADNTTTTMMTNKDGIYWLKDLKPATIYYMRAYAKNKQGEVGYGKVIKFSTVKKGNVTYSYNNAGDAAANSRVNSAATEACDIFNNLTEIVKKFNIGYSSGTPTADCYYADEPWMNMGANASYQRTGTIMHEMQHGLGLVPYSTQWNKNILRERLDGDGRGSGHWLGDRVSAFLDFWDNTTGSQLNGDYQHMWPYGINGASEDHGSLADYYANAMIGQALGEDGLEHRSNTFAEPCYLFVQDDNVKYYLKNESDGRGLYTSYLVPTASGSLQWRTMAAAEAQQNDSAAWYITFTPANQYYQLRNAATGQNLTYSSNAFRTMKRSTVTDADNFHLMMGRVDVNFGEKVERGYWLIHPTGNLSPNCLQANVNGAVGSATFDIQNSAAAQRWLILTAEEMVQVEKASVSVMRQQIADILASVEKLQGVPHREDLAGADQIFADALADIRERLASTQLTDLVPLADEARMAARQFLGSVSATDMSQPFDITYMLQDAGIDTGDGWSKKPSINYSCGEFYQTTFDMNQTLTNMPAGNYLLRMQGFQRPGTSADAYNAYVAGTNNVTAYLYAGAKSTKIVHVASEARSTKLGGSEATVGTGLYVPNNMQAASLYFAEGLYENSLDVTVATDGSQLKIGLRSASMPSNYWAIFDNFRLGFFGNADPNLAIDPNHDGVLSVADVDSILSYIAGDADKIDLKRADVNGDGKVDIADVLTLIGSMTAK